MMAALENARHERFAQELAKGKTQEQAYIDAGYSPDAARVNASRLMTNDNISGRVDELKQEIAKVAVLDVAAVVTRLVRYADKGEQLAEAAGLSVARASMMDAAKLLGFVVDKSENKHTISHEDALDALDD
jgi:phage terminase small subunit